jgi:Fic family protein
VDTSKFTANKTGRLVAISTPEPDFAFVPDPLPPSWDFHQDLWPLLVEAKWRLGKLDGVARTLPNPQLFLKPLQRVESLTSSRLEGTYATAQELMLFEINPKDPHGSADQTNAWQEVANYSRALAQGYSELRELPLCLRLIKDIHRTLLTGVRGAARTPGEFRTHQVHVGSARRYVPAPPREMQECLNEFERYMNASDDRFDPLVRCFIAHYQIEAIHPFGDGNGRIGRVILSLMIYKWCELSMPWLYLSPFFERYKEEYIDNLFKISSDGAWRDWIEFCLRGVIQQAKKATEVCERLQSIRDKMHKRTKADGGTRIHAIIESLFDAPLVRIVDIMKRHSVHYATAKADVHYLVGKEILAPLAGFRVKTFLAPEIFNVAYRDVEEEVAEPTPKAAQF